MKRLLLAVPLIILFVFAAGGSKPTCTPVEPEEPVCSHAYDCEGLPHILCLGEWECAAGECVWNCAECAGEGESLIGGDKKCCEGLEPIDMASVSENGECIFLDCLCFVCAKCGNGICGKGENKCNCPEDCKESCEDNGGKCKDYCMTTEVKLDFFCENGACCLPGKCDDGTQVTCKMMVPVCPFGTILAIQENCYKCVNPDTCEPPKMCGGIAGFKCGDGEVCNMQGCYPDAAGYCVAKPLGCPKIYMPVCGCDGVTYGNDCLRILAGAAKDHDGECEKECKVLNPYGYGSCEMILGVVFDGKQCVYASGCGCEPDCQYFFDSFEECEKVCELSSACPVPFDYKYATAADINKNPAGYNGAPVYLTGDVKVGPAMCTLMACSPENPCCNSCGASMEIYDGSGMIELNSGGIGQVGCGGNECTYMNNCKPFSPDPGFLIWGKIQVYYNYPYLNVDGYCKK